MRPLAVELRGSFFHLRAAGRSSNSFFGQEKSVFNQSTGVRIGLCGPSFLGLLFAAWSCKQPKNLPLFEEGLKARDQRAKKAQSIQKHRKTAHLCSRLLFGFNMLF